MSDLSSIEWTDATWNPVQKLTEPLRWKKPRRIFVNSMSDLFQDGVPDEFIEQVFSVMWLAKKHTFQVLTKRPERMHKWFAARRFDVKGAAILRTETVSECAYAMPWPLPNVWLGVSVEDQHFADERIPVLLNTPAVVRFISAEPLLGSIDLNDLQPRQPIEGWSKVLALKGQRETTLFGYDCAKLDWVIVGGESGAGARPCNVAWVRSIVQQCQNAGVPLFVKQLGQAPYERRPYEGEQGTAPALKNLGRPAHPTRKWFAGWTLIHTPTEGSFYQRHPHLRDRKGGDPAEWPADLRMREFPRAFA